MTVLGKLGAIRRVVRVQYRLEWEYDGISSGYGSEDEPFESEPVRKAVVRHVNSAPVAYRMAAMRLIFVKRNDLATGLDAKGFPSGCSLCDAIPLCGPEDEGLCRYHGGVGFAVLRKRLARWLRWRDTLASDEATGDRRTRNRLSRARANGLIGRVK
jgi:hypothetical protein